MENLCVAVSPFFSFATAHSVAAGGSYKMTSDGAGWSSLEWCLNCPQHITGAVLAHLWSGLTLVPLLCLEQNFSEPTDLHQPLL